MEPRAHRVARAPDRPGGRCPAGWRARVRRACSTPEGIAVGALWSYEWHNFPEGEEPEVLTGVSVFCDEGKHEACPGHAISEQHESEPVFCICPCHQVPQEA